jgi:hypothetical protein
MSRDPEAVVRAMAWGGGLVLAFLASLLIFSLLGVGP